MDTRQNRPGHSRATWATRLRHPWTLGAFGAFALLGMVAASAVPPVSAPPAGSIETVLEQLGRPEVQPLSLDDDEQTFLREERIQRSDTIGSLFSRLGVSDPAALAFIQQDPAARNAARQLRPGKSITARTTGSGELLELHFPLGGADSALIVEKNETGFAAIEKAIEFSPSLQIKSGEISNSLFGATDEAGIPDSVAVQLAEIFSGDIDFYRDLRKGDRFSVVYESLTHNGQDVRGGKVLAAEFVNDGAVYQAFWFASGERGGYYTAEGKSLRKAFLRSPLEFSRVTSGFSNSRRHPVLNITRAHKGIDYGAPTGTRIRAVADATVEFAGRQGGYGNLVILRHRGNYSTAYGHMNGFAAGIRKGARVSQGDTIGYVGQTGIATGPHLHYEFRVAGKQVNPATVALPTAIPLDKAQLAQFHTTTNPLRAQLDLAKQVRLASAE